MLIIGGFLGWMLSLVITVLISQTEWSQKGVRQLGMIGQDLVKYLPARTEVIREVVTEIITEVQIIEVPRDDDTVTLLKMVFYNIFKLSSY
jgi:hypothetical protein